MLTYNIFINKDNEMRRRILIIDFESKGTHKYDLKSDVVLKDLISAIRTQEDYPEYDDDQQVIRYGLFCNNKLLDENKTLEDLSVCNSEKMLFKALSSQVNQTDEEKSKDATSDLPFSFYPINTQGNNTDLPS